MERRTGVSLTSYLGRVEAFIHRRLEEIPNNCLRFRSNQALFFLLTLLGDPMWCYGVRELYPKTRFFSFFGRYCMCDWEPIGMNLVGLVDHLIEWVPMINLLPTILRMRPHHH